MDFFALDIFFAILITMGPLKVVLVYGEATRDLSPELRRRIAVKAVGVAAVVGLLFIVLGKFLLDLFHFSIGALTVAGGAILFIFAIGMVLSGGKDDDHGAGDPEAGAHRGASGHAEFHEQPRGPVHVSGPLRRGRAAVHQDAGDPEACAQRGAPGDTPFDG